MTTLRDLIKDYGKQLLEIEADPDIKYRSEAYDKAEELLDETMDTIATRLIGIE